MILAKDDFEQNCVRQYLKEYEDYDQALTAVASWQSVFELDDYASQNPHFDWFPEVSNPEEHRAPLPPDFAVFIEPDYGLVGEIKPSLPKNQGGFDTDLEQLAAYCRIPFLRDRDGNQRAIRTLDVVITISEASNVTQITNRIVDCFQNNKHPFSPPRNVIVMEHGFVTIRGQTFFKMERIPLLGNGEFLQQDLHKYTTTDLRPIRIPAESFMNHISQHIVMNDTPQLLVLMVLLWVQVFSQKLTLSTNRSAAGRRTIFLSPDALCSEINKSFFSGRTRLPLRAIRDSLRAFRSIGLARLNRQTRQYVIEERQLIRKSRKYGTSGDLNELAMILATRLCRKQYERKEKKKTKGEAAQLDF